MNGPRSSGLELSIVDAFTDRPFSGNPAAIALVDEFPDDHTMQLIARELNLSETAFVVGRADGSYNLRWFAPAAEVDLCGHATLASAHVLGGPVRFHTRSGILSCSTESDGMIEMDFPIDVPSSTDRPVDLSMDGIVWYGRGRFDVLIELDSAARVRELQPAQDTLAALDSRGVIVTARGDHDGVDCVSRFFAPNVGIPEDPVTGSAHCTLAPFWAQRTGKRELAGEQASARGGTVRMDRETTASCWRGEP